MGSINYSVDYDLSMNKGFVSEKAGDYLTPFQLQTLLNTLNRSRNDLIELLMSFEDIDNFLYKGPKEDLGDVAKNESYQEVGILQELQATSKGIDNLIQNLVGVRNNIVQKIGYERNKG